MIFSSMKLIPAKIKLREPRSDKNTELFCSDFT